jgi:hypothetical protein
MQANRLVEKGKVGTLVSGERVGRRAQIPLGISAGLESVGQMGKKAENKIL